MNIELKNLSILIVEDEYIVALYLQELLENMGVTQTEIAGNQDQVNNAIKNQMYDAAFVDIRLREVNEGINIARNLKKAGQKNIIFASADSQDSVLYEALAVSTDGIMLKPFRAEDVKAILLTSLLRNA